MRGANWPCTTQQRLRASVLSSLAAANRLQRAMLWLLHKVSGARLQLGGATRMQQAANPSLATSVTLCMGLLSLPGASCYLTRAALAPHCVTQPLQQNMPPSPVSSRRASTCAYLVYHQALQSKHGSSSATHYSVLCMFECAFQRHTGGQADLHQQMSSQTAPCIFQGLV